VARLRAFGVDRSHSERAIPGFYEVPSLGLNYRMSEMQAALGRTQTARLPQTLERRRGNFETLAAGLRELPGVHILDARTADAHNSHYCLVAVLEGALAGKRNEVMARLNAVGVGTSIYYPQPVPRMKYYQGKYGYDASQFPVATSISDGSVALPVGQHLDQADMRYVAEAMRVVVRELQ
jgi:perosamine synthetase